MKNIVNVLKLFFVIALLSFLALGINYYFPQKDANKLILGNWQLISNNSYTISFSKEGKVEEKLKDLFASGTWFLENKNKKDILVTVMGEEKKYNIELLNSNNLVIIDDEGIKLEFKKKK